MSTRDIANQDVSAHAAGELDVVLERQRIDSEPLVPTVSAKKAMAEERVVQSRSDRITTRVLFISQNTELLNPSMQSLDGYVDISDVFDEVHILILRQGIIPKRPVIRPKQNVFLYTAAATHWWQLPAAGMKMIASQLSFADGLRPDVIVALDPCESALTALWAGRRYDRPTQLHVMNDVSSDASGQLGLLQRTVSKWAISHFLSIRAATVRIHKFIAERAEGVDLALLPRLNPYNMVAKKATLLDLQKKYPQYVFQILYVGQLDTTDAVFRAIDAAKYMLRNSQVCLIILGNGSGLPACRRYVNGLGIAEQVIFETKEKDHIQYLKAADLLVVSDTDQFSEELVLQGAAACIPMVMTRTEKREDTFVHLESAYLCTDGDVQAYSDGVYTLMSDVHIARHMQERAFADVQSSFHNDQEMYKKEYRTSVEAALFAGDEV